MSPSIFWKAFVVGSGVHGRPTTGVVRDVDRRLGVTPEVVVTVVPEVVVVEVDFVVVEVVFVPLNSRSGSRRMPWQGAPLR